MWRTHDDTEMTTLKGHSARLAIAVTLVAVGAPRTRRVCGLGAVLGRSTGPASGTILRLQLDGVVDPFIADYLEKGSPTLPTRARAPC